MANMKAFILLNFITVLSILPKEATGIRWLALSKVSSVGAVQPPDQMCNSMKGSLIKKQINFCKRNPSFMDSVRVGAVRAIDECQFQFRTRRWNCSTLEDKIRDDLGAIKHHLQSPNYRGGEITEKDIMMNMNAMKDMNGMASLGGGNGGGGGGNFPAGMNMNFGGQPLSDMMRDHNPNNRNYRREQKMNRQYTSAGFSPSSSASRSASAQMLRNTFGGSPAYNSVAYNLKNDNGYGGNRRREIQKQRTLRRGRRLSRKARQGAGPDLSQMPQIENNDTGSSNEVANRKALNKANKGNSESVPVMVANHSIPIQHAIASLKPSTIDEMRRKNSKHGRGGGRGRGRGRGRGGKRKDEKKEKDKWVSAVGPYPVVSPGTKEMAFVHAIASAGVAHALTRACSAGELENCGCDRSLKGTSPAGFEWSGCSDNVDFGITFSRSFVDARDRRKSKKKPKHAQPLMNLHNNEAGRKLLERNMKVECKCHGVSGSCELKTCWRSVASFRKIGEILKEKFDNAHEVQQKKRRGRRMLLDRRQDFKPHTDTDLVYLKKSPDYCEYDPDKGSLGTKGRECNPKSNGIDGCGLLCCNRGYKTKLEKRVERCKCKFHWCCFVECEECITEVNVSTCL